MAERRLLPDANSEFAKGSRVGRDRGHEKTEAAKHAGIPGQTVHRRGFIPVAAAEQKPENAGQKALGPLLEDIEQKVERLTQVVVWLEGEGIPMESEYEGEKMSLLRFIANSFRAAKDSAGPYLEDETNTLVGAADFQADKEKIEEIQDRFAQLLEGLKDQVASIESATGEDHRDVPSEIKALLEESTPAELPAEISNPAELGGSLADPAPESGPDAGAEAKFAELESSVQKWLGIRGRIRDLVKGTAFDDAMRSLPAPDFAKQHKSEEAERVIRLWRKLLAQGKKPDEELQAKIDALERNSATMIPAGETLLASLEAAQGGRGKEDQETPVRFADLDRDELMAEFGKRKNRAKIMRLQTASKSLRLMIQEVDQLNGFKELKTAVENSPGKDLIHKAKREQKERELNAAWKENEATNAFPKDFNPEELFSQYHDVLVATEALLERLRANPPKEAVGGERAEGVSENPGPELEAELQEKWRAMRGNPEAKVAAVETLLAEWKEVNAAIRQFSDETRVRSDIVSSGLEPRKFEKILDAAVNEQQVETRLATIRKNMEEHGALSDEDAGFLTANFHNYHQLIAAGRVVVREREREAAVMAAEEAVEGNPENDPMPKEKLLQANELIARWRGLCDEFGVIRLRKAIWKKYPREAKLPVVPNIDAWLEKHKEPKAWRGRSAQRNQDQLDAHLRDLTGLVKDAEIVAADIRSRKAVMDGLNGGVSPETRGKRTKEEEVVAKEAVPMAPGTWTEENLRTSVTDGAALILTSADGKTQEGYRMSGALFFSPKEIGKEPAAVPIEDILAKLNNPKEPWSFAVRQLINVEKSEGEILREEGALRLPQPGETLYYSSSDDWDIAVQCQAPDKYVYASVDDFDTIEGHPSPYSAPMNQEAMWKKLEEEGWEVVGATARVRRNKRSPLPSPDQVRASSAEAEFSEKLDQVKKLVQRWDGLGRDLGFKALKDAVKADGQGAISYTESVRKWFEMRPALADWKQKDRADLVKRTLPDMEALLVRAEAAAKKLQPKKKVETTAEEKNEDAKPEVRGNVTILATGRTIESDTQMTAWENLTATDARAFIQLINTVELNGFQRELKRKLTEKGITNSVDRLRVGRVALDRFMPGHIRKLAKEEEWNFEITNEEIEKVFMVGLRNNLFVS